MSHDEVSCPPHDRCSYCGCCQHTPAKAWCKTNGAPVGMACPESGCGCEGRS